MIGLYISQDTKKTEFEVFGYGFKNLGYCKEFLLFLAATISPLSATLSAYRKYLEGLRAECLKRLVPNAHVREIYSIAFKDSYFEPLFKPNSGSIYALHGLSATVLVVFLMMLLLLLAAIVAASFVLQVTVIYDVASHPSTSKYVNLFVVSYSLTSIALAWVISVLQLPLPDVDMGNVAKLSSLQKEDPEKYKRVMGRIASDSAKRDRDRTAVISGVIFIVAYCGIFVIWMPSRLADLGMFVGEAIPGAILTVFLANRILLMCTKTIYKWFFAKYPEESEERVRVFSRTRKAIAMLGLSVPTAIAVLYTISIVLRK
jgi:hypothetical protein